MSSILGINTRMVVDVSSTLPGWLGITTHLCACEHTGSIDQCDEPLSRQTWIIVGIPSGLIGEMYVHGKLHHALRARCHLSHLSAYCCVGGSVVFGRDCHQRVSGTAAQ